MTATVQARRNLMGWTALIAIAIAIVVMIATDYPVNFHKATTPVQTSVPSAESAALADARLLCPEPEEFIVAVGLTASGSLSPACVDLRPGLFYEVVVPESRRDSYYIRPKGADATVITTWDGWKEKLVASEDEMLRDKGNHLLFREDGATYTEVKVFASDHRDRAGGYLRIKFKVVPDARFPRDRDKIANGRPLRDGE